MKTQPKEGYWFSDRKGVLPHGDWRPYEIGIKLSVKGKLVICKNALHGSFDPFDAMRYAPGPILHKVLFSGARIEDSDKVGSRSRTIIATRDAETMLYAFARKQALSVADAWEEMPPVPVIRQYLETGDETLRTEARHAARSEDRSARSAAEHAAWSAAWGAARACAEGAARSAADGAARSVAWGAAGNRACSEVWSEVRSAAEGAAWTAAWTAADNAARVMFNQMVMDLFTT